VLTKGGGQDEGVRSLGGVLHENSTSAQVAPLPCYGFVR
jgi:hypothetical protein